MVEAIELRERRRLPVMRHLRGRQDLILASLVGGLIALLMNRIPIEAALISSVIGAFLIIAFIDTRIAVLSLLLVRSVIDATGTVPLVSASGGSQVNAAAMMSFIAIAVALAHISLNHLNVRRMPLAGPSMLFLGITLLGVAVAPDRNTAMQDWVRTLSAFLIYVLLLDVIRTKRDMRWLTTVLVTSTLVPILVGVQQYFTNGGNHDTPGLNRIYGTFGHPAAFSMFLAQLLPLVVVLCLHTRHRLGRIALFVLIPAILFSIYEAQTRGAWLGIVMAITIFMGTRARWSMLLVPLIMGTLYFGVPSIRARFDEASSSSGSVVWRQEQWSNAVGATTPVHLITIGAGFDAVSVRTGNLTHNEYIRLLVETGLAGLITMFVLYRRLLLIALDAYRNAIGTYERDLMLAFLMAFAARVVIALSDNIIVYPVLEWYFWGFAALVVAASGAYQPVRIGLRAVATAGPRVA